MGPIGNTIRLRKPEETDLPECLDVQPAHLGHNIVGRDIAIQVWKQMLAHPACIAAVLESDAGIVGFGVTLFVTAEFAEAEMASPRPFMTARIIASVYQGRSVLLTPHDIARSNAGAGLNSAMPYGSCKDGLDPQLHAEVRMRLTTSLTQLYAGYKIRRVFGEAEGDEQVLFMRRSGIVREIGTFPEFNRTYNVTTSQEARAQPFSMAGPAFTYRPPVLRLSAADQELLLAALDGAPDTELAAALDLTLPAVKARWRSIIARFAEVEPSLTNDSGQQHGRGPQKRHRIVAYVRRHPEELRPFES